MRKTSDTYLLLRAFVDELARCGMQAACTSPGSRSAPLVLSLAADARLRCYSHIDERCSGFFALGLAKASGLPVAVACTSGTAAAQLLAAVIEAHEARVPLLVLSADRPAELRDNGAGQAIDQIKLFGDSVKWFVEVSVQEAGEEQLRWIRTLACRAYATALDGRPGAVHLNFPHYEPLTLDGELSSDDTARPGGAPFLRRRASAMEDPVALAALRTQLARARRGVIVAGRHERAAPLADAACKFAERAGWPLLADPLSGARRGAAAVAHYDALLREPALLCELEPDFVLRVGDLPVSKALRGWLAQLPDVPQVALDPEGAWQDPASRICESLSLEPAGALAQLTGPTPGAAPEDGWLERWQAADRNASQAITGVLAGAGLSEPGVAAELGTLLSAEVTLFVASSMPVRDIETFWPVRQDPPRVLCNRGANGIDGTVSSAFGAAAAGDGPVLLLIGDVALAHDIGGLLAAKRLQLDLTIVLLDNNGGGIFDFLPVADAPMARSKEPRAAGATAQPDIYERHISTPTGLDFSDAATLYGLGHELVEDLRGFRAAVERSLSTAGTEIIEVRGERAANVALHRATWAAVSAALSR